MNRFYKAVTTGPAVGGGWVVLLDGRPVRTPQRALMTAPSEGLANAVAREWESQGETIIPETMPLTQILTTATDHVAARRQDMMQAVLPYLNGDLLCYRAGEPETLAAEQDRVWGPWLAWFTRAHGPELETTFALSRIDQPRAAHDAVLAAITAMDTHRFAVFQTVVALTGSMVLGLAFVDRALTAEQAFGCALCEELFYERVHDLERHGLDPIEERRRAGIRRDLEAGALYLSLL